MFYKKRYFVAICLFVIFLIANNYTYVKSVDIEDYKGYTVTNKRYMAVYYQDFTNITFSNINPELKQKLFYQLEVSKNSGFPKFITVDYKYFKKYNIYETIE